MHSGALLGCSGYSVCSLTCSVRTVTPEARGAELCQPPRPQQVPGGRVWPGNVYPVCCNNIQACAQATQGIGVLARWQRDSQTQPCVHCKLPGHIIIRNVPILSHGTRLVLATTEAAADTKHSIHTLGYSYGAFTRAAATGHPACQERVLSRSRNQRPNDQERTA